MEKGMKKEKNLIILANKYIEWDILIICIRNSN